MVFENGLVMTIADGLLSLFQRPPVKWRGTLFVWEGNRWLKRSDAWLEDWIMVQLMECSYEEPLPKGGTKTVPIDVTRSKVADIAAGLLALVVVDGDEGTPMWFGEGTAPAALGTSISLADVVVPLAGGDPFERTDDWFDPVVVPVTLAEMEQGECPIFERCLEEWGMGCPIWKEVVLRTLAYGLMGTRRYAKTPMFYGTGRGGKGTLDKVESMLMGGAGKVGTRMEELVHTHGLEGMEVARVVTIHEFTNTGNSQVGRTFRSILKSMLGEDEIAVNPKGKKIQAFRLGCVPKILTNELPEIEDQYGSFWGKVVMVPFQNSFLGREDIDLIDKLEGELAGIAKLVVEAGKRLVADKGKFPMIPEAERFLASAKARANPILMFLQTCCEPDRGSRVGRDTLHRVYNELRAERPWLRLPMMSPSKFTQEVKASGWEVKEYRFPISQGNLRGFQGIRLVEWKDED